MRLRAYNPSSATTPETAPIATTLRGQQRAADVGALDPMLVVVHRPADPLAAAMRELRSALVGSKGQETARRFAVLGLSEPRLGAVISANLAAAFAEAGQRTLLVDCNLGRGQQHRLFGLGAQPGLTDVLSGRAAAQGVIRPTAVRHLSVLPAGAAPGSQVLNDASLRDALGPYAGHFEMTLLDASAGGDGLSACVGSDGVVVLARQHVTSASELKRVTQWLALSGVPVASVLLIR